MPLSLDVPDRFGRRVGEEGLGHLRALVYDAAPHLGHFGLKRALTPTNTNSSSSPSASGDALYRIEEPRTPGQQQQQQGHEQGESDADAEGEGSNGGEHEEQEVFRTDILSHTAPEGPALLKHSSFHPLLDKTLGSERSEASVSEVPMPSTLSSASSQPEHVGNHEELDGVNEPSMTASIYERKKQYAEEIDDIRSKTLELDAISSDISAFVSSTHAVSEAAAGGLEAIGSKFLQEPPCVTTFSAGAFWEQVRADLAQGSRQHQQALKRTRENCVMPLSLHSASLHQRLHLLLAEADELGDAIEKAGEKCEAAIIRCNELNEVYKQMCIVSRKRPEQLNTTAKLRLIEAQSDAYKAKMQRVEVSSSFRNLAAHFCSRMPQLIDESRTLNRTRLQHLNSSVKEFISARQQWLHASLEQSKRLELCSNKLDLEADAAQFGVSHLTGNMSSSSSSSSTRDAVLPSSTQDLKAYINSAERTRSYPLDMWGAEGFERALQQEERSKNTLRQLVTALEGWSAAMNTSSKSLHRLVGQASKKISGSEREKAASKSLVACLNNESRHLATTAKTLQSGASILSVIRTDGKNLKKTLSEQKLRFDKENRVATEALAKALSWRTQCQQEFGAQSKAMTALGSFEACPRQSVYEKQLGVFKQSQAQMLQAEKKWRQAERVAEATHTKQQVCMAHFMHMLQDASNRRTTDVKLVLERLQTQLRKYLHSMMQNFETVEKNVTAIDADVEIVEFIQQQRGRSSESSGRPTFIVSLDDGPVSFSHQLGRTSFEAVRSHFRRGIDAFKQLTRFFEERNLIDDVMLKGIRKLPLDLTSADASTLTDAFASFRKLMDCTLVSVDERNTRVAEVTRAMVMQRKVMKASLAEFTQQYNRETRQANQASDTNKALLAAYKKALSSLKQAREGHEQATLRERKSLSADGSVRRKSFMQTVLRKPVRKYREKLDSALEAAEKAHALSEEATRALDAAVEERNRCVNNLLDGLQQAQRKRVETMRFAMLACLEQYHTTTEKMVRQSDVLARSIEAVDAARDVDAFIRANTSSQQPPECVISAHLEALKEVRERSMMATQLWSEDSNSSELDEAALNTASTYSGSGSLNASSTSTPSDDAQSVVSWRVDTISKRKAARRHERGDKADDLVELFNCDLDKELQLEDEADANEPEAEDRTEMSPFSQPRLTTEELCHQCIEQLRYRDITSSDITATEQEQVGIAAQALRRDLADGSVSATLSKAASETVLRLLVLLLAELKERPLCSSSVLDCLTPQLLNGECRENEPTLIQQMSTQVGALLRELLLLLLHASSRNKPCKQELVRLFAVAVMGENETHDIARLNWLIENCEAL